MAATKLQKPANIYEKVRDILRVCFALKSLTLVTFIALENEVEDTCLRDIAVDAFYKVLSSNAVGDLDPILLELALQVIFTICKVA